MQCKCPPHFTVAIIAESAQCALNLRVRPGTEYAGTFAAWCEDSAEMLDVNGQMFDIEEIA